MSTGPANPFIEAADGGSGSIKESASRSRANTPQPPRSPAPGTPSAGQSSWFNFKVANPFVTVVKTDPNDEEAARLTAVDADHDEVGEEGGSHSRNPTVDKKTELLNKKKEEELKKREAELAAREAKLREDERKNIPRVPNFPFFWPVMFHNIEVDIPASNQPMMRKLFKRLLFTPFILTTNMAAAFAVMISHPAGDTSSGRDFGVSIMYFFLVSITSFFLWYRPAYTAYMRESSMYFSIYFLFGMIHIIFDIYMTLGIPGSGSAGVINAISAASDEKYVAGIMSCVNSVFWIIGSGISIYLYRQTHLHYRSRGLTAEDAQKEAAKNVAGTGILQGMFVKSATASYAKGIRMSAKSIGSATSRMANRAMQTALTRLAHSSSLSSSRSLAKLPQSSRRSFFAGTTVCHQHQQHRLKHSSGRAESSPETTATATSRSKVLGVDNALHDGLKNTMSIEMATAAAGSAKWGTTGALTEDEGKASKSTSSSHSLPSASSESLGASFSLPSIFSNTKSISTLIEYPWLLTTSPPRKPPSSLWAMIRDRHLLSVALLRAKKHLQHYELPDDFVPDANRITKNLLVSLTDPSILNNDDAMYNLMLRNLSRRFVDGYKSMIERGHTPKLLIKGEPRVRITSLYFTYGPYPAPETYVHQEWLNMLCLVIPEQDSEFISHPHQKKVMNKAMDDGVFIKIRTHVDVDMEFVVSDQNDIPYIRDKRKSLEVEFISPHFTPWDEIFDHVEGGDWKLKWDWRVSDVDGLLANSLPPVGKKARINWADKTWGQSVQKK
ncbi:hypothetical protein HDU76_004512 [Blyttiomyces sp. JEL0837]|nr:hypothetical protein HDU76_004512 [Blyttiomyces sp. JEL0837]